MMYLNVTLWTLDMVCRKFKIYIPPRHFHVYVAAMKPFRIYERSEGRIPIYMIIVNTSKEPVCPRVELILKIIIILLIIFLGFIKSKPC